MRKGFIASSITDLYAYAGFILILIIFFFLLQVDLSTKGEELNTKVEDSMSNIILLQLLHSNITLDQETRPASDLLIKADAQKEIRQAFIEELNKRFSNLTATCAEGAITFSDGENYPLFNQGDQGADCALQRASEYLIPTTPSTTLRIRVNAR